MAQKESVKNFAVKTVLADQEHQRMNDPETTTEPSLCTLDTIGAVTQPLKKKKNISPCPQEHSYGSATGFLQLLV